MSETGRLEIPLRFFAKIRADESMHYSKSIATRIDMELYPLLQGEHRFWNLQFQGLLHLRSRIIFNYGPYRILNLANLLEQHGFVDRAALVGAINSRSVCDWIIIWE
jgi:hypothetical protein